MRIAHTIITVLGNKTTYTYERRLTIQIVNFENMLSLEMTMIVIMVIEKRVNSIITAKENEDRDPYTTMIVSGRIFE